jgi:serine/threonine-protein kinase RsbW
MMAVESREFVARISALSKTAAFVADFCESRGIAHDDSLWLELLVEELFTNSVVHGYGGDSDATIFVALSHDDGEIALVFEDAAPAFDPLSLPPVDVGGGIDSRQPGGLGIHLVRQVARNVQYERDGGRNRIRLTMACHG